MYKKDNDMSQRDPSNPQQAYAPDTKTTGQGDYLDQERQRQPNTRQSDEDDYIKRQQQASRQRPDEDYPEQQHSGGGSQQNQQSAGSSPMPTWQKWAIGIAFVALFPYSAMAVTAGVALYATYKIAGGVAKAGISVVKGIANLFGRKKGSADISHQYNPNTQNVNSYSKDTNVITFPDLPKTKKEKKAERIAGEAKKILQTANAIRDISEAREARSEAEQDRIKAKDQDKISKIENRKPKKPFLKLFNR